MTKPTIEDLAKKLITDAVSVRFSEQLYRELDRQRAELKAAGCEITEEEIVTAALRQYLDISD